MNTATGPTAFVLAGDGSLGAAQVGTRKALTQADIATTTAERYSAVRHPPAAIHYNKSALVWMAI